MLIQKRQYKKSLLVAGLGSALMLCAGCGPANGQAQNGSGDDESKQMADTSSAREDVKQPTPTNPGDTPSMTSADDADPVDALETAAKAYWQAKVEEDWAELYEFLPPHTVDESMTAEVYEAWARANEPFVIHGYEFVAEPLTEGDYGWVHVKTMQSMRNLPAGTRENTRWQRWFRDQSRMWRPVFSQNADMYPDSPAVRDAENEALLRAQLVEAWDARLADNWVRVFDLTDPEDRAAGLIELGRFTEAMQAAVYDSYKIHWVEVKGDQSGRARIEYHYRFTDPTMAKVPQQRNVLTEYWIKRDGDWVWDVSHAGDGN